jgi:hypothetical protein
MENVRVFMAKPFARFARRERIADSALLEAVERAEMGLVDADLGGGVIKQRVARPGKGRSGGYRTFIAFRSETRAVFVFGFAKSERDNIDDKQLATLKRAAALWLEASDVKIALEMSAGSLQEIEK